MNLFPPNEHDQKVVVINQPASLGDVLFIEPIYRHYHEQGYEVIAPVNPEILWVQPYIPYVKFIEKKKVNYNPEVVSQKPDGRLHVPTRFSNPLYRGFDDLHYGDDRKNWMGDKYLYLALPVDMWRTMKWDRKIGRETLLFEKLGITGEFNLVNEHFGTSSKELKLPVSNGLPNVYMRKVDNFTLLDWAQVIERATNIFTVETSVIYLIEVLNTVAKELHLYPRYPYLENVDYIKDYLKKPMWKFHDHTDLQ